MINNTLRIGIVGATPRGGWARFSHVPAIAALPDVRLTAVATTRRESAEQAAAAFGADHGFDDPAAMAACADVDLVAVSVKAPLHFDVAMEVMGAGKPVFCEWPMGANLAQSRALAEAAARAGVRSFVGLQARAAPVVRHARALVAQGYLGRVYAASMWGAFSYWGDPVQTAYSADVANGANILTIPGGHGLDVMAFVLDDEVVRLSGWESHLRDSVMTADRNERVPMTAPDQFAVAGMLGSGALFSAHFVGVAPRGEAWRLHLAGDRGELTLECDGMPEIAPMRLSGTQERGAPLGPIAVEAEALGLPAGPAENVGRAWAMIAADLRDGGNRAPDFAVGARRRAMLDGVARSHVAGGAPAGLPSV